MHYDNFMMSANLNVVLFAKTDATGTCTKHKVKKVTNSVQAAHLKILHYTVWPAHASGRHILTDVI